MPYEIIFVLIINPSKIIKSINAMKWKTNFLIPMVTRSISAWYCYMFDVPWSPRGMLKRAIVFLGTTCGLVLQNMPRNGAILILIYRNKIFSRISSWKQIEFVVYSKFINWRKIYCTILFYLGCSSIFINFDINFVIVCAKALMQTLKYKGQWV